MAHLNGLVAQTADLLDMTRTLDLGRYPFLERMQTFARPVSRITGLGISLPERVVDNHQIAQMVEAPPEVRRRLPAYLSRATGIQTRRHADRTDSPSDFAAAAARSAMEQAGVKPESIDTIIFASTDRDLIEPATANILQKKLGLSGNNAFDVSNACNSVLQAINVANSFIAAGAARCVLIACGELDSQWACYRVDSLDELQVKLGGLTLGDAGAALIMERSNGKSGITEINLLGLGEHWKLCHVPEVEDWRRQPNGTIYGWFYLDMPELARLVRSLTQTYIRSYTAYRMDAFGERNFMEHMDMLIPHQISRSLILQIAASFLPGGCPVPITAHELGNTGSAAIPVALYREIEQGRLSLGTQQDVVLFGAASGLGVGHIRMLL